MIDMDAFLRLNVEQKQPGIWDVMIEHVKNPGQCHYYTITRNPRSYKVEELGYNAHYKYLTSALESIYHEVHYGFSHKVVD